MGECVGCRVSGWVVGELSRSVIACTTVAQTAKCIISRPPVVHFPEDGYFSIRNTEATFCILWNRKNI